MENTERGVSYDEVPYNSLPFRACHPETMAVIAAMEGLEPAPAQKCRVMEIGCAGGGHLLPIAAAYVDSEFVGVDLSSVQIGQAQELAEAADLKNVTLLAKDICQYTPQGEFDFIIAHGVYSWSPAPVRQRLLDVCATHLSPRGVAIISYMVYPGAYVWCALRHAMKLGTRDRPPKEVAPEARRIADVLADAAPKMAPRWGPVVAKWSKDLAGYADHTLLHDQLEAVYHPVYLTEFVDQAAASGLRYLADAARDDIKNVAAGAREQIEKLTADPILQAQYVDIGGFRMFRQSLLCRKDAAVGRADPLAVVERAHLASDKFLPGAASGKAAAQKVDVKMFGPVFEAALSEMSRRWPKTISFAELRTHYERAGGKPGERLLAELIYKLYTAGRVELWMEEPTFIAGASDSNRPRVTKLARVQADKGKPVTNLRHEAFAGADERARKVVASLDGREPSAEVAGYLANLARNSMLVSEKER